MSTIRVDNLQASDGLSPAYDLSGIPKAMVVWDANTTGAPVATRSHNITSLTDDATGDTTVNYTNAFDAADYALDGMGKFDNAASDGNTPQMGLRRATGSYVTTSSRVLTTSVTSAIVALDLIMASFSYKGDLA